MLKALVMYYGYGQTLFDSSRCQVAGHRVLPRLSRSAWRRKGCQDYDGGSEDQASEESSAGTLEEGKGVAVAQKLSCPCTGVVSQTKS